MSGEIEIKSPLPIRVCVVDDDPFVIASLITILAVETDICVVGEGRDGQEAIGVYAARQPDVMLMDIQMPNMDGLAAAERILAEHPGAHLVFLTTFSDDEYIVRALRLGAKGYLIKQEVSTIAPAIRSVFAGQSVLGGEVLGRVEVLVQESLSSELATSVAATKRSDDAAEEFSPSSAIELGKLAAALGELSAREGNIVSLVAEGLDNKEIASRLYIGEGTVRNHISAILQKLALKNRTQLAIAYYRTQKTLY